MCGSGLYDTSTAGAGHLNPFLSQTTSGLTTLALLQSLQQQANTVNQQQQQRQQQELYIEKLKMC